MLLALVAITVFAYVTCLAVAARRLRRTGSFADRLPAWILVVMQALWYVVPVLALNDPERVLPFATVWVSTAHSAQYLWITAYYAKRSAAPERVAPFLFKALIAGGAVTVLPGLLFAPGLLGALSWDGGLALLVFSVVNIHHFILDGAIWKLRDQSIARVLLRRAAEPSEAPAAIERGRRSGFARLVWGTAMLSLVVPLVGVHEESGDDPGPRLERARADLDQVVALDPNLEQVASTLIAQLDVVRRHRGVTRSAAAVGRAPDGLRLELPLVKHEPEDLIENEILRE